MKIVVVAVKTYVRLRIFFQLFPWSEVAGQHWFLPFSVLVPLGWCVQFISESFAIFGLSCSYATFFCSW